MVVTPVPPTPVKKMFLIPVERLHFRQRRGVGGERGRGVALGHLAAFQVTKDGQKPSTQE